MAAYKNLINDGESEGMEGENFKLKIKFFVLFLSLIQILSEIGIECKEKALLLYKIFKFYFVENEKKWINLTNKIKDKVSYYKELCKIILKYKNTFLPKIETISDVMFSKKLSEENLDRHKKLIQDLLQMVNERRDEIYMLKANIEILQGELNFWVYDYENLKISAKIREAFKDSSVGKIVQNVKDEMVHKNLSNEEKSLLINSDRYLISSGQRNYFFDQKQHYVMEIDRLSKLYQKHYYKKRQLKIKLKELNEDYTRERNMMKKEIDNLREKLILDLSDKSTQTDIDKNIFIKMEKNHEIIVYQKRLNKNKLSHFIEKIKNNSSKYSPISKKSLLNLIPELYNEKSEVDIKCEMGGTRKLLMDELFHQFMSDKFKINNLIKKNCEQTIIAILKFSSEDTRIDLIRKFIGIGDDKIRREILDVYISILKNLPISFFRLFDDDNKVYLMNSEICFELYYSKFQQFDFVFHTKDHIISVSSIHENDKEIYMPKDKKFDYFLLSRMYARSLNFVNDLIDLIKTSNRLDLKLDKFIESFQVSNREFDFLSEDYIIDIFKRHFVVDTQIINENLVYFIHLDSFLNFFLKKYYFKIKIDEFLDLSLKNLLTIFQNVEKIISKYFDNVDIRKLGVLYNKEFDEIMNKIMANSDNKWKIGEYFYQACGSQDKDFITKDEFIIFCLNNNDILSLILFILKKK